MTNKAEIKEWLARREPHHTHMVVVCDTWDWTDYPVFTDDPRKIVDEHHHKNMEKVMEVYDLNGDLEAQLNEHRAWHLPTRQA